MLGGQLYEPSPSVRFPWYCLSNITSKLSKNRSLSRTKVAYLQRKNVWK